MVSPLLSLQLLFSDFCSPPENKRQKKNNYFLLTVEPQFNKSLYNILSQSLLKHYQYIHVPKLSTLQAISLNLVMDWPALHCNTFKCRQESVTGTFGNWIKKVVT